MSELSVVKDRAKTAVAERLRSIKGDAIFRRSPPKYTLRAEDNLITGVTREDFWKDLEEGDGKELKDSRKAPAKFCAAYSSSALAVNSFGPFRHSPDRLNLPGFDGFNSAKFERKCPTGLDGKPPNLDFFAAGSGGLVAFESKFLETLDSRNAKFVESYNALIKSSLTEPVWRTTYEYLIDDSKKFKHLDAAQLVKHYLGIRNTFSECRATKVLFYVYWEPLNAEEFPVFQEHQNEIAEFSDSVSGSEIEFVAHSYSELWQFWSTGSQWNGMLAHIDALRRRYELNI